MSLLTQSVVSLKQALDTLDSHCLALAEVLATKNVDNTITPAIVDLFSRMRSAKEISTSLQARNAALLSLKQTLVSELSAQLNTSLAILDTLNNTDTNTIPAEFSDAVNTVQAVLQVLAPPKVEVQKPIKSSTTTTTAKKTTSSSRSVERAMKEMTITSNNNSNVNSNGSKKPASMSTGATKKKQSANSAKQQNQPSTSGDKENNTNNENVSPDNNTIIDFPNRMKNKLFIPVTQSELDKTSHLIKTKKTSLATLNEIYASLYNHFQYQLQHMPPNSHLHHSNNSNNNALELSVPEMTKNLGLKVTGVTGTSYLKVLRDMGIVKLTSQGGVRWICPGVKA